MGYVELAFLEENLHFGEMLECLNTLILRHFKLIESLFIWQDNKDNKPNIQ